MSVPLDYRDTPELKKLIEIFNDNTIDKAT